MKFGVVALLVGLLFSLSSVATCNALQFFSTRETAAFSGMETLIEPVTGLPIDIASISDGVVSPYDFKTSPTDIGLWIDTIIAERDSGFITQGEALKKLGKAISTIESMEKFRGLFYNWYYLAGANTSFPPPVGAPTVGSAAARFVSSVDNANLTVALMMAAAAFLGSPVADRIEGIIKGQDYSIFYRRTSDGKPRINQGYHVDTQELSPYDYGTFMTEARLLVFLSIVKEDVPNLGILGYMDTPLTACKTPSGKRIILVVSWGGSLFEELYPDLFLDEKKNAPNTLGENHRRSVRVQIDHASSSGLWGWSPSEDVHGKYRASGIPCLGAGGQYPMGDISPYSILLAALYAPQTAAETLQRMETINPLIYDPRFGYRDSITKDGSAVSCHILSLDKGMEVLALFDAIARLKEEDGLWHYLWKYLSSIGKEKLGLQLLSDIVFPHKFYNYAVQTTINPGAVLDIPYDVVGPRGGCAVGGGVGGLMNGVSWKWVPCETMAEGLHYDVSAPGSFAYFAIIPISDVVDGKEVRQPRDLSQYTHLTLHVQSSSQFKIQFKRNGSILYTILVPATSEWKTLSFDFLGSLVGEVDEITIAVDQNSATSGSGLMKGVIDIDKMTLSG